LQPEKHGDTELSKSGTEDDWFVGSAARAEHGRGSPGRTVWQRSPASPQVLAVVATGRSYRLIGCEVGLNKNTIADIIKRRRTKATLVV